MREEEDQEDERGRRREEIRGKIDPAIVGQTHQSLLHCKYLGLCSKKRRRQEEWVGLLKFSRGADLTARKAVLPPSSYTSRCFRSDLALVSCMIDSLL